MCTEKSNGGPFVTFREECEILRARVAELEAQLAEAKSKQVSGFFHDEVPTFQQGEPNHEVLELITAKECTAMLVPIDTYHALIEPAADLLAKRDQRRDASLLRKLSETFRKKENWGIDPVHYLLRLASECESGEWNPDLEVK